MNSNHWPRRMVVLLGVLAVIPATARAQIDSYELMTGNAGSQLAQAPPAPIPPVPVQPPPAAPAAPDTTSPNTDDNDSGGDTLALFNSSVGYVDPAIPGNMVRTIGDAAYGSNVPNRAGFFYARGAPIGPGLEDGETKVDYQQITQYIEHLFRPNFSVFVDIPVRFINPTVNGNAWGLSDIDFGTRYAFYRTSTTVSTFQFRTYVPSGNAQVGLGNNHVSLEPAWLNYHQFSDRLRLETEVRLWSSIGGRPFNGDIIRYGAGLSYGKRSATGWWASPVAECVAWTVIDGQEAVTFFPGGPTILGNAAGETIINAKLGVRAGLGQRANIYMGYGQALTGDVLYKDIVRCELRIFY